MLISLTVALTAAGAYIKIPVGPVPITLQTFVVLLAGAVLGPWHGAAAMGAYVLAGLMGLPVFAAGGGPQYVLMPTFGFLLSFPVAAIVVGKSLPSPEYEPGYLRCLVALTLGTAVVYTIGFPCLWLNLKLIQDKQVGFLALSKVALIPFLPGDIVKIVIGARLITPLRKALTLKRF